MFNKVNNKLLEKGFISVESQEAEGLGSALYESKNIRVFLKEIHTDLEIKSLQTYANQIRSLLMEQNKNIYNTYLVLCTSEEIDFETFYMIERNTIALRKYVIRNADDLNRIPFLDDLSGDDSNKSNESNILFSMDYDSKLDIVFDFLEKNNARNTKLKDIQIEEIVSSIIKGMDNHL